MALNTQLSGRVNLPGIDTTPTKPFNLNEVLATANNLQDQGNIAASRAVKGDLLAKQLNPNALTATGVKYVNGEPVAEYTPPDILAAQQDLAAKKRAIEQQREDREERRFAAELPGIMGESASKAAAGSVAQQSINAEVDKRGYDAATARAGSVIKGAEANLAHETAQAGLDEKTSQAELNRSKATGNVPRGSTVITTHTTGLLPGEAVPEGFTEIGGRLARIGDTKGQSYVALPDGTVEVEQPPDENGVLNVVRLGATYEDGSPILDENGQQVKIPVKNTAFQDDIAISKGLKEADEQAAQSAASLQAATLGRRKIENYNEKKRNGIPVDANTRVDLSKSDVKARLQEEDLATFKSMYPNADPELLKAFSAENQSFWDRVIQSTIGVVSDSGNAGSSAAALADPDLIDAMQTIRLATLGLLRATLGAAFTADEGLRVMRLNFDPSLSMEVNLERAKNLENQLRNVVQDQRDMREYRRVNGTSLGYTPTPRLVGDTLTVGGLPATQDDLKRMGLNSSKDVAAAVEKWNKDNPDSVNRGVLPTYEDLVSGGYVGKLPPRTTPDFDAKQQKIRRAYPKQNPNTAQNDLDFYSDIAIG